MHPDSFKILKTSCKRVYVTPCASLYSDAANCLSVDVGSSTKLVGVKTSPSHKVLSRSLNVNLLSKFLVTFLVIELDPLLLSDVSVSSGSTRLSILSPKPPTTQATSLMMSWSFSFSMKLVALSNKLSWKKLAFFFFVAMSRKRNHPCFSLMQSHTIFNMKMQCNVFLPPVLSTRRQFQRLKYSVCPSAYTDDLIFTRKN